MRVIKIALLVPGILLGLFLTWVSFWLAFHLLPPFIVWTCLLVMGTVCAWFIFGRQKSAGVLGSEASLLGRQSSNGGLL